MGSKSKKVIESYRWDALPLVNRFFERLHLDQVLSEYLPSTDRRQKLPPAKVLGVLVRNLVISRRPLYAISEWVEPFKPSLLGLTKEHVGLLNDDRVGRALDRLFDTDRPSLVMRIVLRAIEEFDLRLEELHNDSTTITLHGQYRQADGRAVRGKRTLVITWGKNKDFRPDLKQLLWVLTVTADGAVPVHHHVYDGNTADDVTHRATWELMCQVTGQTDFIYVSDCKLCSGETMRYIDQRGGRFVTVMPRTRKEDEMFRQWMQNNPVAWESLVSRPNLRGKHFPEDLYSGYKKLKRSRYSIEWEIDEHLVYQDARSDGIFPLMTNERMLTMKELLLIYKRQPEVEKRHDGLKNVLDAVPQYLKSAARIEAFLCAFFIALLVDALIERELRRAMADHELEHLPIYPEKRPCKQPTTNRVLELFEGVQSHRLRCGSDIEETFPPELDSIQRRILQLLRVPKSHYLP